MKKLMMWKPVDREYSDCHAAAQKQRLIDQTLPIDLKILPREITVKTAFNRGRD